MLAHHGDGQPAALVGQFEVPVACDVQKAVALHPGDGLAHCGPALLKTLGDARAQRHYALFFEVVDGAQVHLGGIDQIVHGQPFVMGESTGLAARIGVLGGARVAKRPAGVNRRAFLEGVVQLA